MARDARPGPDRLDPAAVPRRARPSVGTQATALPPASPVRTDRPPRTPNDPAPLPRLALGSPARRRVRTPPSAPNPNRLTPAPPAPPPRTIRATPPASACPQTVGRAARATPNAAEAHHADVRGPSTTHHTPPKRRSGPDQTLTASGPIPNLVARSRLKECAPLVDRGQCGELEL
jgi:hypothetical protein